MAVQYTSKVVYDIVLKYIKSVMYVRMKVGMDKYVIVGSHKLFQIFKSWMTLGVKTLFSHEKKMRALQNDLQILIQWVENFHLRYHKSL